MADSYVCSGATMWCSCGTGPAKLTVLPSRTVFLAGQPMANITDHITQQNIAPFCLCTTCSNPAVSAAQGTPQACIPVTLNPWENGKDDYLIKGQPALLKSSICRCQYGGIIRIIDDGQHGEGIQWVNKKPRTDYSPNPLELKEGDVVLSPDQQLDAKKQTEKTSIVDFAKKVWDTVSPTIANINRKKEEFVDYVCDYVSDYVEQKGITTETFIKQKQEALTQAIKDANQFYGDAYYRIKEEIRTFRKMDRIILWDAYWEKKLVKDENQQCKLIPTKLRFIPQQIEVDLKLVFYFKYDDEPEHDKDSAEFVLNIQVPGTLFKPKKYKILGAEIKKFTKNIRGGRTYYVCSITSFSSDLTKVDFGALGFTEEK